MKYKVRGKEILIKDNLVKANKSQVREKLDQYFNEKTYLDLEIYYPDNFTGEVMKEINRIPYGETSTYGEIAERIDTSAIAVGNACSRNPVPIIVPCHRVVSSTGNGGYQYGELKNYLLELESKRQK